MGPAPYIQIREARGKWLVCSGPFTKVVAKFGALVRNLSVTPHDSLRMAGG